MAVRFPELFRKWKDHDLVRRRPPLWDRLPEDAETVVWEIIEQQYLLKYSDMIRVAFEWSSSGVWRIPFPGSLDMGLMVEHEDLSLPANVSDELKRWQAHYDDNARPGEKDDHFDYAAARRWGFKVAEEVRLVLPASTYLEFHPLHQLVVQNGVAVELDSLPPIGRLAHVRSRTG